MRVYRTRIATPAAVMAISADPKEERRCRPALVTSAQLYPAPPMRRPTRDGAMAAGFIVASFALAFAQRPGRATSDTKIDLHVDPSAFLGQVASVWTHSIDLGAVHGAQYGGYLWPMGPVFALLHGIGLGAWVSQRIWLGLIFASRPGGCCGCSTLWWDGRAGWRTWSRRRSTSLTPTR